MYLICLFPHEVCLKHFETKWRWKAKQKETQLKEELINPLAVDQSSTESGWWLCGSVLTKLWLKLFWFSSGSSLTQQLENDDVYPAVWIPPDDQTQRVFTNFILLCGPADHRKLFVQIWCFLILPQLRHCGFLGPSVVGPGAVSASPNQQESQGGLNPFAPALWPKQRSGWWGASFNPASHLPIALF